MDTDDVPRTLEAGGRRWTASDGYDFESEFGWQAPFHDDEYDWDPEEVDFHILGGDVPQYFIYIQKQSRYDPETGEYDDSEIEWEVSASATNGPDYGVPGQAEPISGEYLHTSDTFTEALSTAKEFMEALGDEPDDSEIDRLFCNECNSSIDVARIRGELKCVCDCAGPDGRIKPQDPDSLFRPVLPYGWEFTEDGADED